MRNLLLYLTLCAFVASCDDDANECPIKFSSSPYSVLADPSQAKYPCDYITADKNDEQWTVRATASYGYENDTIYVHGVGYEEVLGFKFLFTGAGSYAITTKANDRYFSGNAYYYTTIGGDVIGSNYILIENTTVNIIEYNETERIIKGNFEFSFYEFTISSTLNLKQGTFVVHLPD